MLASEKLAIAAHLHVLLRRKTGRVTDTQWMADNLEYAAEIVRFCRRSAQEDGHTELLEWADKLEMAMRSAGPVPRVREPRLHAPGAASTTLRTLLAATSSLHEVASVQDDTVRYVRGLR